DLVAAFGVQQSGEETACLLVRSRAKLGERAGDSAGLQRGEPHGQSLAFAGGIEKALTAVVLAFLLHHVALIDQLLEHATQRLLGDFQDLEQVGNLHARVAVDEMQDAVVRAAEPETGQSFVRIAYEIPVGKEQKLDEVPHRLVGGRRVVCLARSGPAGRNNYVSHVDIFRFVCYSEWPVGERIVLAHWCPDSEVRISWRHPLVRTSE